MISELIQKLLFGSKTKKRTTVSRETEEIIKREWEQIGILVAQRGPSQLRQAVIKADKSLDTALKDIFDGENMGERLKNAKNRFDEVTYNKIWEAHKIRNALVHESGYEPTHYVLTDAIDKLKRGLSSLSVNIKD